VAPIADIQAQGLLLRAGAPEVPAERVLPAADTVVLVADQVANGASWAHRVPVVDTQEAPEQAVPE
jgi:hypothetical protein